MHWKMEKSRAQKNEEEDGIVSSRWRLNVEANDVPVLENKTGQDSSTV